MSDGLKHCPFCGSNMIAVCSETDDELGATWHFIRCTACCSHGGYYQSSEEAVAAWNRRANSPAFNALDEAAQLLDDCLIRIYPSAASEGRIEEAAERFATSGGTISRIVNMADRLRALAVEREGAT